MNSEDILGWQLRVPVERVRPLWTAERRERYLLIPTIKLPLSVDKAVWPMANLPEPASRIFEDYVDEPYEAPNGLDVFQMKDEAIKEELWVSDDYKIIGIGMRPDIANSFRRENFIKPSKGVKVPREAGRLLGFDVCDKRLLSGLMNCGVELEDQKGLRDAYAASINPLGLFDQYEVAATYADDIDRLVLEHVPFVPVGLFALGHLP